MKYFVNAIESDLGITLSCLCELAHARSCSATCIHNSHLLRLLSIGLMEVIRPNCLCKSPAQSLGLLLALVLMAIVIG